MFGCLPLDFVGSLVVFLLLMLLLCTGGLLRLGKVDVGRRGKWGYIFSFVRSDGVGLVVLGSEFLVFEPFVLFLCMGAFVDTAARFFMMVFMTDVLTDSFTSMMALVTAVSLEVDLLWKAAFIAVDASSFWIFLL